MQVGSLPGEKSEADNFDEIEFQNIFLLSLAGCCFSCVLVLALVLTVMGVQVYFLPALFV